MNTTADENGTGAACSLREAITTANTNSNFGGCTGAAGSPHTVSVPSGTYTLTGGELQVGTSSPATITISGAGAGSTVIQQGTAGCSGSKTERVFDLDPNVTGSVAVTITGVTISNGAAQGFGGGAILGGGTADSLTLQNATLSNNCTAGIYSSAGISWSPDGNVTINNTSFSSNVSGQGAGGILYTVGESANQALTITNSTFTGNTAAATGSAGGAILFGGNGSFSPTANVNGNTFTNNQVTHPSGLGGAIYVGGGTANIGTTAANRFVGNVAGTNSDATNTDGLGVRGGTANANNNWWGCNGGPVNGAGCDHADNKVNNVAQGTLNDSKWVVLKTTAGPSTINVGTVNVPQSTTLTASFLQNNVNEALTTTFIARLIGLPVTWGNAVHGTLSNQQTSIQSNGTATATLTQDTTCNNSSAQASVDNVQTGDATATATVTVQCPDLTATKTNAVNGTVNLGSSWTWKVRVANASAAGTGFASYANGETILVDNLPSSNISYGSPSVTTSGMSGTVSCSIASSNLTCTATSAVTINAGAFFDVSFTATPTRVGTYANPRTGAGDKCASDPSAINAESNESNNTCSDSVAVTAPDLTVSKANSVSGAASLGGSWNWTLTVANGGDGAATFASGQTIVSDTLPTTLTYGSPSVVNTSNVTGSANISCAVVSSTLTCTASGGSVTLAASNGTFGVQVSATPAARGTYTNPRASGSCSVDPNGSVPEDNGSSTAEANNACNSNSVTVTAADLTVSKGDDVSGTANLDGGWSWTLTVANGGDGAATFASGQTIVSDDLPNSGVTYGTPAVVNVTGVTGSANVSCSITSATLSCAASGGSVTLAAGTGTFGVKVAAAPSAKGSYANPRGGGACAVDPGNAIPEDNAGATAETNNACNTDTVDVTTAPDLTVAKSNNASSPGVGDGWTWTLHVANGGDGPATFASGETIVSDDLPNADISYGTPTVANGVGVTGAANISCAVASDTLTCTANGGSVQLAASTGAFDVKVTATASAAGTYTNPRNGGSCGVDPANVVPEANAGNTAETNNACNSNSVTVTQPTAVAITAFSATRVATAVRLRWRVANETQLLGFNIYRSAGGTAGWTKLNGQLIPATQRLAGTSYTYTDRGARRGRVYTYRLELIGLGGAPVASRTVISRT